MAEESSCFEPQNHFTFYEKGFLICLHFHRILDYDFVTGKIEKLKKGARKWMSFFIIFVACVVATFDVICNVIFIGPRVSPNLLWMSAYSMLNLQSIFALILFIFIHKNFLKLSVLVRDILEFSNTCFRVKNKIHILFGIMFLFYVFALWFFTVYNIATYQKFHENLYFQATSNWIATKILFYLNFLMFQLYFIWPLSYEVCLTALFAWLAQQLSSCYESIFSLSSIDAEGASRKYEKLELLHDRYKSFFSFIILLMFSNHVVYFYITLKMINDMGLFASGFLVTHIWHLFITCWESARMQSKAKQSFKSCVLAPTNLRTIITGSEDLNVTSLLDLMYHTVNPPTMSACNFFNVDKPRLLAILGTLVTYSIVVIEMSNKLDQQSPV